MRVLLKDIFKIAMMDAGKTENVAGRLPRDSGVHARVHIQILQLMQPVVNASVVNQFFMRSDLDDPAMIEHYDFVCAANG